MKVSSPFPDMDPYLEGHIWPNVHHSLANVIAELLAPLIGSKYVARIAKEEIGDLYPVEEIGITLPENLVFQGKSAHQQRFDTTKMTEPDTYVTTTVTVRIPVVQIRDVAKNQLITCIEILSPVNKRSPGWQPYHEKRNDLHNSGVHLLEIDLLRRGRRHLWNVGKPEPHYVFTLWRKGTMKVALWTNFLQNQLPVLPVPLKKPDPDVPLPLKQALEMIYQRGLYNLSIDYDKTPPPPDFSEEETAWIKQQVAKHSTQS